MPGELFQNHPWDGASQVDSFTMIYALVSRRTEARERTTPETHRHCQAFQWQEHSTRDQKGWVCPFPARPSTSASVKWGGHTGPAYPPGLL